MLADRVRIGRKKEGIEDIGEVYLAQDSDFVKVGNSWVYRGSELEIEIPHKIQGEEITSYVYMFRGLGSYLATPVTRVVSNNESVTNMTYMFYDSNATTLDLSSFNTSNVTSMAYMFFNSQATSLDLSNFDTSKVTNMSAMFLSSQATSLDLSSFDTSNVTTMADMFSNSQATSLDLSSFDTSKVTRTGNMFRNSAATTGYARTQTDADKFNTSSNKPSGLVFVVK